MKRIVIGSDHRGVELAQQLHEMLIRKGFVAILIESVHDYPDVASEVARRVSCQDADCGILFCGTGIGMSITANKFPHVRAVTCQNQVLAGVSRQHNDANVLCLPASLLGRDSSFVIVRHWLETSYEGGRHDRRLEKIAQIEELILR